MANVFYLDVDDEITSAAARIRGSQDPRVGLVVPPGSRIATSRINFRLLAREALERNRALAIVSTDPAARALAASAGLPFFATVAEFEADQGVVRPTASATPEVVPRGRTPPAPGSAATGAPIGAGVPGSPATPPDGRIGARSSGASAPPAHTAQPRSGTSARVAATAVTLIVIALVFGLIAVFLLPSATITITPRVEAVIPLQLSIRADPNVTSPDPVAGVVPAVELSQDFTSTGTFNATGKKTDSTAATGTVRFTNNDTGNSKLIPAGSRVSTASGIVFTTTQDVTVPIATFSGFRLNPGQASVGVTAVTAGPTGNVAAGTIRQVPPGFSAILLRVTNPAAATGGTSTTTIQIQKKDTDAAMAALTKDLKQQFATWSAAPDGLAAGSTAFSKTGILGTATSDTDPTTLIGQAQPNFELTLTATGTETAVDTSTVTSLALGRLQASVPSQYSLVAGSEKVSTGAPRTDGDAVIFPVSANASQVLLLDPDSLRQQVKGKSADEARTILAPYGTVDIQTWPGFVGTIPSLDWRLTLTITPGGAEGSPVPGSPAAGPSALPSNLPSSAPSSAPPPTSSSIAPGSGTANG